MSSKSPTNPTAVSFTSGKMGNKPTKPGSSRLANAAVVDTFGSRPPSRIGRMETSTKASDSHASSRAGSVARSMQPVRSRNDRDVFDLHPLLVELPSAVEPRPRHASDADSYVTALGPSIPRMERHEGVSGMMSRSRMDPASSRYSSRQVNRSSRGIDLGNSGLLAFHPDSHPDSHEKVKEWMSAMGNGERVAKFAPGNDGEAYAQVLNTGFMLSEDPMYGPTPVGPTPSVAMSVDRLSNCDLTAIGHPLEKKPSHLLPPEKLAEDPKAECDATICKEEIERLKTENAYLFFHYEGYAKSTQAAWEERFRNAAAECTKQMSRVVQENMQLREKLDCYERVFTDQKQAIQETLAFFPDLMTCLRDDGYSFSRTLQLNVNREQNFRLEEYQRISWQEAQQKLYGLVKSGEIRQDRLEKGICTDLAPASSSSVSSSKARMVSHEKSFDADSCLSGSGSPSVSGMFSPDVGGENKDGEFDPGSVAMDPHNSEHLKPIDMNHLEEFDEYFVRVYDSKAFDGKVFINRLIQATTLEEGCRVLHSIVHDLHCQWMSLSKDDPPTFGDAIEFLNNVSMDPPRFDRDRLEAYCNDGDCRIGIIRETTPFFFSGDLIGTDLDVNLFPQLFWAVSAEHYLNWGTTASQSVRKLVHDEAAKK